MNAKKVYIFGQYLPPYMILTHTHVSKFMIMYMLSFDVWPHIYDMNSFVKKYRNLIQYYGLHFFKCKVHIYPDKVKYLSLICTHKYLQ